MSKRLLNNAGLGLASITQSILLEGFMSSRQRRRREERQARRNKNVR